MDRVKLLIDLDVTFAVVSKTSTELVNELADRAVQAIAADPRVFIAHIKVVTCQPSDSLASPETRRSLRASAPR